ncbi:MAG: hypothetical protein EOP48_26085, partial [Sphingobacteriales bacterium]
MSASERLRDASKSLLQSAITAVNGGILIAGLIVGSTAGAWSILSFQQFIGYFGYINILFPRHLDQFFAVFLSEGLEQFIPNPFEKLINIISEIWDSAIESPEKYQLPHKFTTLDTPTFFVPNSGSTFFSCIVFMILPYFFDLLRKFKIFRNIKILINIHSNLKWNIPIRLFLESGIPLLFDTLIQMRKISYANVPCAISSALASLALIYILLMLQSVFQILLELDNKNIKDENFENSVGTLYEGLKMKKYQSFSKFYYFIILLRGMLLAFLNIFVDNFPIIQVTSLIVFNVLLVGYVWKFIEFESRYLTWTSRVKEVLIFMAEVFIIALYDQDQEYRDIVAWIIIMILGSVFIMDLFYALYLQGLTVKEMIVS